MNASSRAGGLKQSFSSFWADRNKRERNMLAAAAAVAVLGLFYALLIDPALSGRDSLQNRLPALRQQAAAVRDLAQRATAIEDKSAPSAPAVTRVSLEASLARTGLQPQNLAVTEGTVRLQLANASFTSLVEWLTEMHRTARLTVTDLTVTALEETDRVDATLALRQQRSEEDQ